EEFRPPGEDFRIGPADRLFRGGFVEGAEGDVISTRFACLHGEMTGGMTGDADNAVGADEFSRRFIAAIGLADMDTVRAEFSSKFRPVIDEKGHIALLRKWHQYFGCTAHIIGIGGRVILAFQPELQAGDVTRIKSRLQRVCKGAWLEARGGDE